MLTLTFVCAAFLLLDAAHAYAVTNVNAMDTQFRAAGDGITNDRAAIQSAIDYVSAQSGGGSVTLNANHTFLSGNLILKSNVNLVIPSGTTLLQSNNPNDYTVAPQPGHKTSDQQQIWQDAYQYNKPLIFAGEGTHDIAVTGSGTIRMQRYYPNGSSDYNGSDMDTGLTCTTTYHIVPIAFSLVNNFTISGITIAHSSAFNICLWLVNTNQGSYGTVSNVTITDVADVNGDGISIMNSQNIHVTGCTLNTTDDGIYVDEALPGTDPAKWCYNPSGIIIVPNNIEIDHNSVTVRAKATGVPECHGFCFIPWGMYQDNRNNEIYNINVHDNTFDARYPIGVWADNPFKGNGMNDNYDYSPVKEVTFARNTCVGNIELPVPFKIANLTDDFGVLSTDTLLNGGFENTGTTSWSLRKNSNNDSAGATDQFSAGQDGSFYGYIQYLDQGDAAIYQGVGLTAGRNYKFSAKVMGSGDPLRLFVKDANTGALITSQVFTNTTWQTVSTSAFTVPATGNYYVGMERGTATGGWARIDSAALTYDPVLPYSDDFEDGDTTGWTTAYGSISIGTDQTKVLQVGTSSLAYTGSASWTNYEVSSTVKITSSGCNPQLFARLDPQNINCYYFDYSGGYLRINKLNSGNCTVLKQTPYTMNANTWYTLKAVVNGSTLQFYVNGVNMVETTDTTFTSGAAGVGTYNGTAEFDNFLAANAGNTLVYDEFQDGDSNGWSTRYGSLSVISDGSNVLQTADSTLAYTGSSTWADYQVAANFKMSSDTCEPQLFVRLNPSNIYCYYFDYHRDIHGNQLRISRIDGSGAHVLADTAFTMAAGQWYSFKAVARGNKLEFYVNGAKQIEAADSTFITGYAGVGTYNGSAEFDNIQAAQ